MKNNIFLFMLLVIIIIAAYAYHYDSQKNTIPVEYEWICDDWQPMDGWFVIYYKELPNDGHISAIPRQTRECNLEAIK